MESRETESWSWGGTWTAVICSRYLPTYGERVDRRVVRTSDEDIAAWSNIADLLLQLRLGFAKARQLDLCVQEWQETRQLAGIRRPPYRACDVTLDVALKR